VSVDTALGSVDHCKQIVKLVFVVFVEMVRPEGSVTKDREPADSLTVPMPSISR
jgi:hypothetical protein